MDLRKTLIRLQVEKITKVTPIFLIGLLSSCSNQHSLETSTDGKPFWSFTYYPNDGVEMTLPFGLHDKTGLKTVNAISSFLPINNLSGFESITSSTIEKYLVQDKDYFFRCEEGNGEVTNSFKEIRSKNSIKISGGFLATNCRDGLNITNRVTYIDGALAGSIIDKWGGAYKNYNHTSEKSVSLQANSLTHNFLQITNDSDLKGLSTKDSQLQKRIDNVTVRVSGRLHTQFYSKTIKKPRQNTSFIKTKFTHDKPNKFTLARSVIIPIRPNEIKVSNKTTESNYTLSTDGSNQKLNISYSYNRDVRVESRQTIITTTRSNLNTSWDMHHDARSHKLLSVSGLSGGKGFGYKTTFPEGRYAFQINIIKPIITIIPYKGTTPLFPNKGVIKINLYSHKISATISYNRNSAHIIVVKDNKIITDNYIDKQGKLIK